MKNSKKGFTLVELIIVVAVIALLAAVLIPTFSSLISKANQAKDEALVSNLNKAIALSTEKYDTVYDVLGAVKENAGFDVAKISASVSEHEILWDSVNYCFVYKTEKGITGIPDTQTNKDVKDYQYWQFLSKEIPAVANQKYSIYWAGADLAEANVAVGFDAGEASVEKIVYARAENAEALENVNIRTSGGKLEITAKNDSVSHYGMVDSVKITAVADHSYYEKGEVRGNLEIVKGKLELSEKAVVNTILVSSVAIGDVEIIANEGATVNAVAPTTTEARTDVTNASTIPSEVKKGKVTISKVNTDEYVGGLGTSYSPYLIANGEQAYNIRKAKNTSTVYFKFIADVTVANEIYMSGKEFVIDLNGHSVKLEYADGVKPENGSVFYIGGKGGQLTINDSSEAQTGAVIGSDKTYTNKVTSAVRAGNYGKLIINGGHFYGTSEGTSCIYVMTSTASGSKATVTINGGIFETATPSNGIYYVLNHQDNATTGCTITVNGGKFKNYNPGVTTVDPVNARTGKIVLGEGCTTTPIEENSDVTWYTVSK